MMWKSEGALTHLQDETTTLAPMMLFVMTRSSEVIFGILPECTLQLYALYHVEKVSDLALYSVVSSVLSSAYTMTDASIMIERSMMNSQMRGVASHSLHGYMPDKSINTIGLYIGFGLFSASYLLIGLAALSAAMVVRSWWFVLAFVLLELTLIAVLQLLTRKTLHTALAQPKGGGSTSAIFVSVDYFMMSFAPTATSMGDMGIGGRNFAAWIVYK
jgi:hypothetical protein